MRQRALISLLLLMCLFLCACAHSPSNSTLPAPSVDNSTEVQPPSTDTIPSPPEDNTMEQPTFTPMELTVELVIEWETTDAILSRLDEMSEMLRASLDEVGYPLDRVTLTISTAGGFTADSLAQGGIDAAVLPAVDFLTCSSSTAGIAMSCEDVSETVIALSLAKGQPDSAFCSALFDALTKTESGQQFLALCRPGAVFAVPTEEALQAVQDWVEQQEQGGHL